MGNSKVTLTRTSDNPGWIEFVDMLISLENRGGKPGALAFLRRGLPEKSLRMSAQQGCAQTLDPLELLISLSPSNDS